MSTGAGGTVAVDLLITETGGTWRMSTTGQKSHRNPCFGQDLPVVLRSQSATELSIDINGTAFLRGCITTTATLNSIDGKNLEGVLTDGRHVKFSRN